MLSTELVYVYGSYSFTPLNDIFEKLVSYKDINPPIANVAIELCNRLWYLNKKCVIFSIFDERISVEYKRKIKINYFTRKL